MNRSLACLQTCDVKGKGDIVGGGCIPITAGNGNNETAILRAVDRHSRIGAKDIGDDDIAYFAQTGIVGAGELGACVTLSRYASQIDSGRGRLIHIDACRTDNR